MIQDILKLLLPVVGIPHEIIMNPYSSQRLTPKEYVERHNAKIKAILFIIQHINKELKNITINNNDRILYLKWRKKINQDKLKQLR